MNIYKTPVECFEYIVQWHPVDNHPAITTTLTRSSLYPDALPFDSLTLLPRYPDRGHSPAVTKLLIEHRVKRPPYSIGILTLENW